MKKNIIIIVCFLTFQTGVFSQSTPSGFEAMLLVGGDAGKLTRDYVNPAMKGLMYGMNNGWYSTAKTHKKFGFDISIALNASMIPDKDQVFTLAGYQHLSTTATNLPTVGGEDRKETINVKIPANSSHPELNASFEMPGGIKDDLPMNAVPTPSVHLGFGLPFKTALKVRFVPSVGSQDVKGSLLGLGLQHDLMQYFGPLDKLPLNVSLLAAFTNMTVDYDIQRTSTISGSGQKAEFQLNSYTVQVIASIDFPIISLYGGVGYNKEKSTIKMLGNYKLEYNQGTPLYYTKTVTDPVNIDFDANGFRTTVGARLNLAFFKIFADYTLQEYNTLTAGMAFSFR